MMDDQHFKQPAEHHESRSALLAWAFYDWASNAFATLIVTFVFAAYFTDQVAADPTQGTTLWGNAVAAAGLLVALLGPVLGAAADQGGPRKALFTLLTLAAVTATGLLWFVQPDPSCVALALVLLGLGIVASELAGVLYNAMLPVLAPPERIGRWSGWGWGLGYVGGVACLALALFGFVREDAWLQLPRDQAQHVRATFLLAAAWLLVFALPLLLRVRMTSETPRKPLLRAARDGLRQLVATLRQIRRYRVIVRFLIARMLYVDGLATLFALGGVYAAGTFAMSEQDVLTFGILLNVTAALGAGLFAWLDDWQGPRTTILLALSGLILLGCAILFVHSQTLFWVLGGLLGLFVGPAQAAARSYLGRVAPAELRAELFGLFALSGKATAFAGPFLVGWVTWLAGSQRVGMAVIVVFFVLGFAMTLTLPAARPDADAHTHA